MALHLDEGRLVIRVSADLGEVVHGGNALLRVLVLGRDPEGGTADKLVVLDVHDAARDVAVDDVEGEVERLGAEAEREVDLDEEVDEAGAHVPPDLGLLVHRGGRGHGDPLQRGKHVGH